MPSELSIQSQLGVRLIDNDQPFSGFDVLMVPDENLLDASRNLAHDAHDVAAHIGVVRRFLVSADHPIPS